MIPIRIFEMVEKQPEVSSICELKITDKNSVLIKCPKFELLSLSKGDKINLRETTICIGKSFNLADADHISETYKLIGIREGLK